MSIQNAWQLHRHQGGDLNQLQFRRRIGASLIAKNKKKTFFQGHMSLDEGTVRFDRTTTSSKSDSLCLRPSEDHQKMCEV